MLTLSYIKHFASLHADIAYILIVLGIIIEGEIIVVMAGIFAHLGSINIYYAFLATILGGSIKSVLGYSLGYYLQKHHSHRPIIYQAERRVNYFLPHFCRKPFWSIFLSRFLILGIHWFALIYTGYKKVRIRTFAKAEAFSLLVWSIAMLSIGYFFSYTALSISRDVRKFLVIILFFFLAFFILEKVIAFIIELWENKDTDVVEK
jgi:membrane protein DedA with SNARE-associated domain